MPIELRTQRDGSLRKHWYGRYELNGRRHYINLGVRVLGTPPASLSLKDEGDGAFEGSRAAAQSKLDSIVEEVQTQRDSVRLVEKIYEIKTGERLKGLNLADLDQAWAKLPRRHTPSSRYVMQCRSTLKRFVEFTQRQNPKAVELAHVSRAMARSFAESEADRGVTAKTWNDTLKLLRTTFGHLLPPGTVNPFSGIPTKDAETVFRKPFTPEELKAIIEASQADRFIRPILITGICTAMRRGDCCLLKWEDADLEARFITVKTAKTGQTVSVPIFPMLHEELAARAAAVGAERQGHVFPEQAELYLSNPDGITARVRKVLATAGFRDSAPADSDAAGQGNTPESPALAGAQPMRGEIHAQRKNGLRRASIRDFHSFRVTWVTLALTAGVPLELVQKVTGHQTTDIVLKHYFQPGREDFREALHNAMPQLMMNGQKSQREQIRDIVEGMTAKTLKQDKARVLQLLK